MDELPVPAMTDLGRVASPTTTKITNELNLTTSTVSGCINPMDQCASSWTVYMSSVSGTLILAINLVHFAAIINCSSLRSSASRKGFLSLTLLDLTTGVLLLTKETCGFTEIKAKGRDHLWCTLSFSLSVCLPVLTLWVITVSTVERYLLILIDKATMTSGYANTYQETLSVMATLYGRTKRCTSRFAMLNIKSNVHHQLIRGVFRSAHHVTWLLGIGAFGGYISWRNYKGVLDESNQPYCVIGNLILCSSELRLNGFTLTLAILVAIPIAIMTIGHPVILIKNLVSEPRISNRQVKILNLLGLLVVYFAISLLGFLLLLMEPSLVGSWKIHISYLCLCARSLVTPITIGKLTRGYNVALKTLTSHGNEASQNMVQDASSSGGNLRLRQRYLAPPDNWKLQPDCRRGSKPKQ